MEKLMIINHPDFGEVRNVVIKGEPWFVAQDICKALGHSNSRMLLSGLDEDETGVTKVYVRSENGVNQQREVQIVNESGLYTLLMRSNKPEAKPFRKWVAGEVLPAIRKYGFYVHPSARLSRQEEAKLKRLMLDETKRYIIKEDIKRCARRFGVDTWDVEMVLSGKRINNDMMTDLQSRALVNRENWKDAYHPRRMMEVVNKLKGKRDAE